jgi:hypothetical protein
VRPASAEELGLTRKQIQEAQFSSTPREPFFSEGGPSMARNIVTRPIAGWGAGPLPNAKVVLQLTFAVDDTKPDRRASLRVSLTASQAREIGDALHKMADATVMGQTPVAPPSQAKN